MLQEQWAPCELRQSLQNSISILGRLSCVCVIILSKDGGIRLENRGGRPQLAQMPALRTRGSVLVTDVFRGELRTWCRVSAKLLGKKVLNAQEIFMPENVHLVLPHVPAMAVDTEGCTTWGCGSSEVLWGAGVRSSWQASQS